MLLAKQASIFMLFDETLINRMIYFTGLDFTWTMGESKWPHNHQLEDVVNLNCETSQNVRPRPVMSIWVVHAAQENTKLVESSL
jgi:hypothetical protein